LRVAKKELARLTLDESKRVAEDLGVGVEDVQEMVQRLGSYDALIDGGMDDDDDNAYHTEQYLESQIQDPADIVAKEDWDAQSSQHLTRALFELDDRSREIVERRWLTDEKSTLQELADQYQVSAERIRQIESAAMKKLRTAMA